MQEPKPDSKQEKLPSLLSLALPYALPYIIFLGMIRVFVYYFNFGINIFNFIEIQEIVTSFFLFLVLFVLIIFIEAILLQLLGNKLIKFSGRVKDSLKNDNFKNRLINYTIKSYEIWIAYCFIIGVSFLLYILRPDKPLNYMLDVWYFGSFFILQILYFEILRTLTTTNGLIAFLIGAIALVNIMITVHLTLYQVHGVKKWKAHKNVVIEFYDNSTFYSNENYYYIGKTKNFIFIHSETKGITRAIPMERIKEIIFESKDHRN